MFLILELHKTKKTMVTIRNSRIKKNQLSINFSVILMTILFIVFTSAGAVCSQFYDELVLTQNGKIILFASDCLTFSYHGLNIMILCVSNKLFLRRLRESFFKKN